MEHSNILELAKNKILILYIINQADKNFEEEALTSFILKNELLNFFLFKQYIAELLKNNFIRYTENDYLTITEDGKNILNIFSDKIPLEIKEKISRLLDIYIKNEETSTLVFAEYLKDELDRFFVNLSIEENNLNILNLTLEVPNEKYAKSICKKFKESPDKLYMNIINFIES